MKKTFKIASVILALAMIFSVVGVTAFAYDASAGQSSLTNVTLSNGTITGNFSIYGWLNNIEAHVGSETGTLVGTYANPAGDWTTSGPFSITLSDGGNATASYFVVMTNTSSSEKVVLEIPYSGPSYAMEIRRNGSKISNVDLGLNEGTASGFSFVYEAGHGCTYEVSDDTVITVSRSGDNFTVTPNKVGTATITAKCDGTNAQILTVNVIDDSSLSAIWYATQGAITNGASFEANCGKSYGFGVEAFPDDVTVTLTANTANAAITESDIEGQFPYAIKGTTAGGSATVNIAGQTKTISFTVNFTESAFDFFMDSSFDEVAEPLIAVPANTSVTVYANKSVANWAVEGNGCTYTTTGTSITLTGVTVDSITTITAKDASGKTLQWFDAYVTGEAGDEPEPPVQTAFISVFKIGEVKAYNSFYDVAIESECVPIIINGKAYVPMRASAICLQASIEYVDPGYITYNFGSFAARFTVDVATVDLYTVGEDGSLIYGATMPIAADQVPMFVNGKAYVPARTLGIVAGFTGTVEVEYVEEGSNQYVLYSLTSATAAQKSAAIAAAEAKF